MKKSFLRTLHPAAFTLGVSVLLVAAYNFSFWERLIDATGGIHAASLPLHAAVFLILVLVFNALLTCIAFRPIIKPLVIGLLLATSAASYFSSQYGTAIDVAMIQNLFETDKREAIELVSWRLLMTVLLLGFLPALAVARVRLRFDSPGRDLLIKLGIVTASLAIAVMLLLIFFKSLAPIVREHRELRFFLTPTNYLQATNSLVRRKLGRPPVAARYGTDAVKGGRWQNKTRKTVTVIVVGETARAMNFSLNGYTRNTNPALSRQAGLINFTNVWSCGTSTGVSVPCVFSALGRAHYSESAARSQQGLLDVLAHAGFAVLWRDNNSGCKWTCDRVQYENLSQPVADDPACTEEECYDERLLHRLPELIRSADRDMVIVLHQKGSHGPAYWKRYPKQFQHFEPVCTSVELEQCSTESIVAAYDNTILYTDYFLSRTIDLLRKSSEDDAVDTSLIYFSDHGESLGENNLYLHGAPYIVAPEAQRHVPFMVWLSDGFGTRFRIDRRCLTERARQPFSHDNVFHSTLGMLNVTTTVYNPALDLFQACTNGA